MQAGFALVEAGLTRAKSVANIMMKNLMDFCAGASLFFAVGYAIALRRRLHRLRQVPRRRWLLPRRRRVHLRHPRQFVFFTFQVAFAATAATIVSGAMAERTKFKGYLIYSSVICLIIYPVVVRWQWGGGWLFQGGIDDARSTTSPDQPIVHMTGGIAALGREVPRAPDRQVRPRRQATQPSPATTSRSRSWAASSSWSAGTASTPAPSSPPTRRSAASP